MRNGCPTEKDGNVYLFNVANVDEWLSTRRGTSDLEDAESNDLSRLHKIEQIRKTRAEATEKELKNAIDQRHYLPREEAVQEISASVSVVAKILGGLKINIGRIAPEMPSRVLDLIDREQAKAMQAIVELDENYLKDE